MTGGRHTPERCQAVNALLGHLGDRWTLRTIIALEAGPKRFNHLRRAIEGVFQQMLARVLRGLERDGMVSRTVFPTVPPKVEYALTSLGASLADQGRRIGGWAGEHIDEVVAHQERYDSAS
jgi:DNA-binding HxlR family transcriptional regulator